MARDIWFISDTHFGHDAAIRFAGRPFASAEEADAAMAEAWCAAIKPADLVYHLGDVAWNAAGRHLFERLPGTKRLILGNHDNGKALARHVQKIELLHEFRQLGFVATHMPMMREKGRAPVNVHGHLHHRDTGLSGYINISVEKTNYRPLHIDEVAAMVAAEIGRMRSAA